MHLLAGKARHRLVTVLVSVGHIFRNPALDALASIGAAEQDCRHDGSITPLRGWTTCARALRADTARYEATHPQRGAMVLCETPSGPNAPNAPCAPAMRLDQGHAGVMANARSLG